MSILALSTDVLPFMQMSADDSYGNVARLQGHCEQYFKTYCGRNFEQTAIKEVVRFNRNSSVFLEEYPVTAVTKISTGRLAAITVQNSNTLTSALATVTATGVSLSYNYGTATTLLFATYTSLSTLAAAINAAGNGWSATVLAGYETCLSVELITIFAAEAINNTQVNLYIPRQSLSQYDLDDDTGEITTPSVFSGDSDRYDFSGQYPVATDMMLSRFPPLSMQFWWMARQYGFVYVNYTAGYTSGNVPQDLKFGILAMIQNAYTDLNESTFGVKQFRIEGYMRVAEDLPPETKFALELYKRRRM